MTFWEIHWITNPRKWEIDWLVIVDHEDRVIARAFWFGPLAIARHCFEDDE